MFPIVPFQRVMGLINAVTGEVRCSTNFPCERSYKELGWSARYSFTNASSSDA